jgi:D-arabinose 1-dehydrogenase-like Zn-dependent alcohol dehydrogenase
MLLPTRIMPSSSAVAFAQTCGSPSGVRGAAREFIRARGGVDLALEFVGRQSSAEDAVRALRDGGRAVIVGLGEGLVPAGSMMSLVLREREILGSYGSEPEEVREVLRLLGAGELEIPGLVGETIGLDEVLAGVERVAAGQADGRLVVSIS